MNICREQKTQSQGCIYSEIFLLGTKLYKLRPKFTRKPEKYPKKDQKKPEKCQIFSFSDQKKTRKNPKFRPEKGDFPSVALRMAGKQNDHLPDIHNPMQAHIFQFFCRVLHAFRESVYRHIFNSKYSQLWIIGSLSVLTGTFCQKLLCTGSFLDCAAMLICPAPYSIRGCEFAFLRLKKFQFYFGLVGAKTELWLNWVEKDPFRSQVLG